MRRAALLGVYGPGAFGRGRRGGSKRVCLEVKGGHFRVLFNDTRLFEGDDATFKDAGKVGLWTKADSVTSFDDLTVKTGAAR